MSVAARTVGVRIQPIAGPTTLTTRLPHNSIRPSSVAWKRLKSNSIEFTKKGNPGLGLSMPQYCAQGLAARSETKLPAIGLPNPVVRSHPAVVGMPGMPDSKSALSPIVMPLKVCGTISLKSPDGRV